MSKQNGLYIIGTVNAKDVYEGKNATYHTLDISCLGSRSLVPVEVDAETYHNHQEGQPFECRLGVKIDKYGTKFEIRK